MLLVRRWLAKAAIRRAAVIVDVTQFLDDGGKEAFVDVTRGEAGLAVVRGLVIVV